MTRLRRFYQSFMLRSAVLACLAGAASAQTPDPKSKANGSISGRATMAGKAAPGIAIAAYGGDLSLMMASRRAMAQAITDSDGRYHLFGLAPGTYQVAALAPNLTGGEPAAVGSFGPAMSSISKSIVLASSENIEDIDLKLVRGSVITGRIKDADGKPVTEQRVALMQVDEKGAPLRGAAPLPFSQQMYQTDDRGIYRLYGLPAGKYKVSVGSDPSRGTSFGGTHIYYPQTFFGDVTDQAKATIVELSEGGESANIDIQVARPGETYSATGRIIDSETGQPVVGVRFSYGPAPKSQPYFAGFSVGLPTNAKGEFRIDGLEPGRYGVSIASEFEASTVYSDPAFFEVTDGDVSNLEVKTTHGLTIGGVVVTDGITNRDVLTQLTSMRIGATVSSTSQPQTYSTGVGVIAGDGSFSVSGLRPGKANLYLSAIGSPGVRGLTISRIEREGADVTRTLEIQPGQTLSDLRVILIYGTGIIRGTVKFENGTLPPGSRAFIAARREGSSINNIGAQLDARGRFVMTNLAAGTYEVSFSFTFAPGTQPPQRRPTVLKQFATVADDAEAEITFNVDLKPVEGGP